MTWWMHRTNLLSQCVAGLEKLFIFVCGLIINIKNNSDMSDYDFIQIGSKVFWHDPDGGLSDGEYQVVDAPEEVEEDSIILIASDYSEAEAFPSELSPL